MAYVIVDSKLWFSRGIVGVLHSYKLPFTINIIHTPQFTIILFFIFQLSFLLLHFYRS